MFEKWVVLGIVAVVLVLAGRELWLYRRRDDLRIKGGDMPKYVKKKKKPRKK